MTNPSEMPTPACQWRVGAWCLQRLKDRLHDAEGISVSDGADLSAFADMLRRAGKNGAGLEDLLCQAGMGLYCRYASPMPNYDGQLRELSFGGTMLHRFAPSAQHDRRPDGLPGSGLASLDCRSARQRPGIRFRKAPARHRKRAEPCPETPLDSFLLDGCRPDDPLGLRFPARITLGAAVPSADASETRQPRERDLGLGRATGTACALRSQLPLRTARELRPNFERTSFHKRFRKWRIKGVEGSR